MKYKFNLKIDTSIKFSNKKVRTPDINRRSNNNSPNVKKHRISVEKNLYAKNKNIIKNN